MENVRRLEFSTLPVVVARLDGQYLKRGKYLPEIGYKPQ